MATKSKPVAGALTITPPDGYRYSDDHDWDQDEQKKLTDALDKAWISLFPKSG
jgi:hypothetical protein